VSCENLALVTAVGLFRRPFGGFRGDLPDVSLRGVDVMKVIPLGDKVAVKRLEADETTAGGIILPDAAREKPQQGRVLSVGDGRLLPGGTRISHQVQEGDRILFSQWAGVEIIVDQEEVLIMKEDEILAVLE
jgi:chaperonin GroES